MEKVIFLFLLLAAPAWSAPEADFFQQGNALYAEGRFSEAAQTYQRVADQGVRHWALEFNLGNAYYREGRLGKAILHYERAFQLNPGQRDVVYNLNLASQRAGDPKFPSSALLALGWRWFFYPSVNLLSLGATLLFIVLGTFLGFWLYGRPLGRGELLAGMAGLLLLVMLWLGARVYILEHPDGVVVSPLAEVRSGPSTSYPANFTVPEGHRVLLLKEQEPVQGWHQVGVPREGLRGWVSESSVEAISR